MTVELTPHGQELLEIAMARGVGHSPEETVERALEAVARDVPAVDEDLSRSRQAVAAMREFMENNHFTLGPGERIVDLIR
ncbi:conserved hypothetical protein [Candidatus Sulfopaludibacter sp. SbA4]|nr:conserved hypothetical protein [Candidatus Sulfopaludibacter sp. SbA4]